MTKSVVLDFTCVSAMNTMRMSLGALCVWGTSFTHEEDCMS